MSASVRSRVDTGSESFRKNRADTLALLAEVESQLGLAPLATLLDSLRKAGLVS